MKNYLLKVYVLASAALANLFIVILAASPLISAKDDFAVVLGFLAAFSLPVTVGYLFYKIAVILNMESNNENK